MSAKTQFLIIMLLRLACVKRNEMPSKQLRQWNKGDRQAMGEETLVLGTLPDR
jgi:hypothetical protein